MNVTGLASMRTLAGQRPGVLIICCDGGLLHRSTADGGACFWQIEDE